MSGLDFATAPRSFSRHRVPNLDGASWCARSVLEGIPPVHTWGLDWPRCFHGLGVALGRARMRAFELTLAQQKWLDSPIARVRGRTWEHS